MARLHSQTSNWNNSSQANIKRPTEPVLPANNAPAHSGNINVVTKVVSDYDPSDVTVARTIVQPIAIVPYNTTEQPLYQYESQQAYGQGYTDEYSYGDQNYDSRSLERTTAKKGLNALKIILMVLSLLYIAVIVVGKFVDLEYLKFDANRSGLEIVLKATSVFSQGFQGLKELDIKEMLFPILLAANCLFVLMLFLASIFSIKGGVSIFEKIIAILSLLSMGGFGYLMYDAKLSFGYGFYAAVALTALIAILALVGKRRRNL